MVGQAMGCWKSVAGILALISATPSLAEAEQRLKPSPEALVAYENGQYATASNIISEQLNSCQSSTRNRDDCVELHLSLVTVITGSGDMPRAETAGRSALAYIKALPVAKPTDLARAQSNLAITLTKQSKFRESEQLLRDALAIWRSASPTYPLQIAITLTNLSDLLLLAERYPEAETLALEAVENAKASGSASEFQMAAFQFSVASVQSRLGKFSEAASSFDQARAHLSSVRPANHPEMLFLRQRLIGNLQAWGKLQEAVVEATALVEDLRNGAVKGMVMSSALALLGQNLNQTGNYDDAEKVAQEALAIVIDDEAAISHQASASSILADSFRMRNRNAEADPYYRQALASTDKMAEPGRVLRINILSGFGQNLIALNQLHEALWAAKEALKLGEAIYPKGHFVLAGLNSDIAAVLRKAARVDLAEPFARAAVEIAKASLGRHPSSAVYVSDLGATLERLDRMSEAERLYREALDISLEVLKQNHPNLASAYYNVAKILMRKGKLSDANKYYRQAWQLAIAIPDARQTIGLYVTWGWADAASRDAATLPLARSLLLDATRRANARLLAFQGVDTGAFNEIRANIPMYRLSVKVSWRLAAVPNQ